MRTRCRQPVFWLLKVFPDAEVHRSLDAEGVIILSLRDPADSGRATRVLVTKSYRVPWKLEVRAVKIGGAVKLSNHRFEVRL